MVISKKKEVSITEDTIAILEKYRKLAMKDIVEKMVINDNVLNFSTMTVITRPDGVGRKMFAKLSLNGKIYQLEYDFDTGMVDKSEFIQFIANALTKEILIQNKTLFASIS